jgi:hypothetical protein
VQQRAMDAAVRGLEAELREGGNWFSGYHGTEQATRTQPMVSEIANINTQLGQDLSSALAKAQNILQGYGLGIDELVAAATGRAAERAGQTGTAGGGEEAAAPAAKPSTAAAKKKAIIGTWPNVKILRGKKYIPRKQFVAMLKKQGPKAASRWAKKHPKAARQLRIR